MTAALLRYRRVLRFLAPRAAVWLGTVAALWLLLLGRVAAGAVLALLSVAAVALLRLRSQSADRQLVARAALGVGLCVPLATVDGWTPVLLLALTAVLGCLMIEPVIARATRPGLTAVRLPGVRTPAAARVPDPLLLGGVAALATLAVGAWAHSTAAVPLVLLEVTAALVLAGLQLVLARRKAAEREVRHALTAHAPRYCLYFSGTSHAAYQVRMWLPYLARTGEPGLLVIRDPRFLPVATGLTELPVVLARSVESLEYLTVPSLGAFFYVNNDARNVDGVRFGGLTHVHLGHGDSDKPASYAAVTAMFDQIFVAGQAGVDRFAAHGVLVPREKFRLVGRPQLEAMQVGSGGPAPAEPVVLYAPTWAGTLGDSRFGSLKAGARIVSALLAGGATVWFRPHPYSARDAESRVLIAGIDALLAARPERPHRSSAHTARRSIADCFNASDALITDISSVASDYLYSNKPFALTDTAVVPDLEAAYPLARAAVLLPVDADLTAPLTDLLRHDPRRLVRAEVRRYYLGDWPAESYAEAFVAAARAAMGAASAGRAPSSAAAVRPADENMGAAGRPTPTTQGDPQ